MCIRAINKFFSLILSILMLKRMKYYSALPKRLFNEKENDGDIEVLL